MAQYQIVTIDDKTYMPNEPSIFINPANPAQIVAGSNIHNHYVSSDTGKTWQINRLQSSHGVYGDPVIYADEYGNFYFCHLSATKGKKFPHWIDRIVVQKSQDGGQTFSDGCYAGSNGDKEQDKHWIIKDQHSMLHKDNIYLSWTEFDKYESKEPGDFSRIRFARSVDGAQSFENAITISDTVGDCLDDDQTLEGATPAVGASGEVCIAWSGHGKIYFDKSTDGGLTWGKDKIIATQADGWALNFNYIYRSNGLPFLVADHSRGKYKNRLYLLWGENRPDVGGEIKIQYSDDAGETWSTAKTVNSESKGDQFLPHIAIDQSDGTVYIVFYDRRHSASNILMDVYVAMSEDGGNTFINKRITSSAFMPPGKAVFFGDYNGISAHKGIVRPIWTGTDETSGGRINIQTALLSKEILKNRDQVRNDTVLFKHFVLDQHNEFVLYSEKELEYSIVLKVKKSSRSGVAKTYRYTGKLNPQIGNNEIVIKTIKGKKTHLILRLKGTNLEETYDMDL